MTLFLAAAIAAVMAPSELPGDYRAVTESEWHLELSLKKDGSAIYTVSSWMPGAADTTTTKETLKGRWQFEAGQVVVELPSFGKDKRVVYEPTTCLSYEEFGDKGCSPGLKPLSANTPDSYSLKYKGLWKSGSFNPSWR